MKPRKDFVVQQVYRRDGQDDKPLHQAIDCSICLGNVKVQIRPPSWMFKIRKFWHSTVIVAAC